MSSVIEKINSNESLDKNKTDPVQSLFKMPKNIRQVGKSKTSKKIYVEDYVMSFIKQLASEEFSRYKVAVLVGHNVVQEGYRNIFIQGAVEIKEKETSQDLLFTNEAWTQIYDDIKKYFCDLEIVGWFLGGPSYLLEDMEKIQRVHLDNFAGQDKTLLLYDNIEKEEAFHIYENGQLTKQEGYYIYYERNEEMQNYMIDNKQPKSEEVTYEDRATKEIRTIIHNKKPVTEENKGVTRLMYAAGTLLAIIVLVVAAAMLDNYDQMRNMEDTINTLADNLRQVENIFTEYSDKTTPLQEATGEALNNNEEENSLDIQIAEGNIKPVIDDNISSIPDKDTTTPTVAPTKAPKEDETKQTLVEVKYYIVQKGDTLAGISYKLYNSANYISVIKELNNLDDEDFIYYGQKLIVP